MKCKLIIFLAAVLLMNFNLRGNTEPSSENNAVESNMNIEINGTLQLYSVLKEEIELIDTEMITNLQKKETSDWTLAYNRDYFIGFNDAKVEAITPSNFKRLAKKYFADMPELAANIGKKGFRYKNLPTIISFYNKKITNGKALTKEDKLLVKEIK